MAVKTITIDMDAYELLDSEKREGESFSRVIKRKLRHAPTAEDVLLGIDRFVLEEETLDRLESIVRARKDSPLRPVRLAARRS